MMKNAWLTYENQIKRYHHEMKHLRREDFLGDDLQLIELETHGLD